MMSVIYAKCHIQALYADCRYAGCHYAGCHYAECRSACLPVSQPLSMTFERDSSNL